MDRAAHFFAGQRRDDPFDLPPMAEAQDVAVVAAALGADGGFEAGVVTEAVDQLGSLVEREPAGDVRRVHAKAINPARLSRWPTSLVNRSFTMIRGLEPGPALCHELAMAKPNPKAGGFFWMAAILAGTAWGVVAGDPMKGILIGTAAGGAIALAVWLLDRGR